MSEDHVQEILDGNSKEYGEIPEASEEKAALKPFLNPTLGYPRTYFVHSPIMNGKSKCNFTETNDPNHNAKFWRYQLIAGAD
eukprot:scaffold3521_cov195-Alexandrium_tamarense.AAC.26